MLLKFLAVILLLNQVTSQKDHTEVSIGVYYMALCPYARQFFVEELYPTYISAGLGKYMNVEILPGFVDVCILLKWE